MAVVAAAAPPLLSLLGGCGLVVCESQLLERPRVKLGESRAGEGGVSGRLDDSEDAELPDLGLKPELDPADEPDPGRDSGFGPLMISFLTLSLPELGLLEDRLELDFLRIRLRFLFGAVAGLAEAEALDQL